MARRDAIPPPHAVTATSSAAEVAATLLLARAAQSMLQCSSCSSMGRPRSGSWMRREGLSDRVTVSNRGFSAFWATLIEDWTSQWMLSSYHLNLSVYPGRQLSC